MRWEIGEIDKLIVSTLSGDSTIKEKMGIIDDSPARVYGNRLPRGVEGSVTFPYIYFYAIPQPDSPGQGTSRIQANVDYDIEVRSVGPLTEDNEAIVDRIDELIGTMKAAVTEHWVVSARRRRPIASVQRGETADIFYNRRGGTYKFVAVSA